MSHTIDFQAKNEYSQIRVVVVGGSGMLGRNMISLLDKRNDIIAPSSSICDLTDWKKVETFFRKLKNADVVINCAAYTKVDDCESNSGKAFAINAAGPQILAKCCERVQIPLIHVSTDYVFDGSKDEYTVKDKPNPSKTTCIYGRSKLLGEHYIKAISSRHFIVRTSWLYGKEGPNFVKTMLALSKKEGPLRVVRDQFGSPTLINDLSQAIIGLIGSDNYGLHHASGEGFCTWYEFAKRILELKGIEKQIIPISTRKSYDLFPNIKARRPPKSILVNTLPMRNWEDALKEFLSHEDTLDL